jgi:hypothetical protein
VRGSQIAGTVVGRCSDNTFACFRTSHRRGLGIIAILAHGTLTLEGFVIRYIISWRVFDGSNDTDLRAFRVLSRLQFRRSLLFCVPGRLFFYGFFFTAGALEYLQTQ